MTFNSSVISICRFCGEKLKSGTICPNHKTKEGRHKDVLKQLEIENENFQNGRKIPSTMFMWNREALLKEYQIDG